MYSHTVIRRIFFSIIFCVLDLILFVPGAFAGTLSCSITTAAACASPSVVIFRMSGATNAHAELPSRSTAGYNNNVVCCGGVTDLGNSCSGTYAAALNLSSTTNAHVEQKSQSNYAERACISVPSGGTVSTGYVTSPATCGGANYDTTLASLLGVTNSHVAGPSDSTFTTRICASAHEAGSLVADIVDADGNPVTSPSIVLGGVTLSFSSQVTNGTFGASDQKIRVDNSTPNTQWNLTIAAVSGPTVLWSAGAPTYDFNDPNANGNGQMMVNASAGTLTPKSGCTNTGLTKGSSASFSEGVTDSITLLTASSLAATDCYWDLIGASVSQTIPKEQTASNYSIDMMLTITAI